MKYLKYLILTVLVIVIAGFIAIKVFSEKKPEGAVGTEANKLAYAMMDKLNKRAFDSIPYLSFEFFSGGHKYFWDKKNNKVIVEWDKNKVIMNLNSLEAQSFIGSQQIPGEAGDKLRNKAWSYWCNDSFWLIAPFKVFDKGTVRKRLTTEEGEKGLLIEYLSGGVTPGDSYLWILNEENIPTGWKMWTSILPVEGLYTSWTGWADFMGAKLSLNHKLAGKDVEMKNVKTGTSFTEFGYTSDPFVI